MHRLIASALMLSALLVFTAGCEDVKKAASNPAVEVSKPGDMLKKATDEAAAKAKQEFIAPITALLPKIEEKIKGLTGDAKSGAEGKFGELKKLVDSFKDASPEKLEEIKTKITGLVAELKKAVGL